MLDEFDLMTSGNDEFLAMHDQLQLALDHLADEVKATLDVGELKSYVRQLTVFYLDNR